MPTVLIVISFTASCAKRMRSISFEIPDEKANIISLKGCEINFKVFYLHSNYFIKDFFFLNECDAQYNYQFCCKNFKIKSQF